MTSEEFDDAKSLWKFFYATECFRRAANTCSYILENNIDADHSTYYPLITAIYAIYGRPFKPSKIVGKLPSEMVPKEFQDLHKSMMEQRDQIYVHTDAKSFDLGGHGGANQVRLRVSPTEARLFGTEFYARPPLLPKIIELCQAMQNKTEYHIDKLQKRHQNKVPKQPGEYPINIFDPKGSFFLPAQTPML